VLRLGACMGVGVDLIEPLGFPFSDKKLKRAGMDYSAQVEITRHVDWPHFYAASKPARLVLLTTRGTCSLYDFAFQPQDILLMGSEGSGVPDEVRGQVDAAVRIPLAAAARSLNLGMSAGIALAEALRQTNGLPQ
jgi:tRNA (cytidine/uridine-2'-O-)-methyltransferase